MAHKLGFSDRRTTPPKNAGELITLLSEVMSASLNNEIDLDNARVALNAATRIVDVVQADTRMKAVAMASGRQISTGSGAFALIDPEKLVEEATSGA